MVEIVWLMCGVCEGCVWLGDMLLLLGDIVVFV